jgi:hypothetical protein
MPRPDLALLPVHYRRIPVLAIGSDVYLDTRLILSTLESHSSLTSKPRLGASNPADKFVEKLIEKYIIEGPVFGMAAGLVPVEMAQDPTFLKDRQGMLGRNWSKEELEGGYGECLNYIRNMFSFLETTVLEDGREWVLGGEGPKMADIEGTLCSTPLVLSCSVSRAWSYCFSADWSAVCRPRVLVTDVVAQQAWLTEVIAQRSRSIGRRLRWCDTRPCRCVENDSCTTFLSRHWSMLVMLLVSLVDVLANTAQHSSCSSLWLVCSCQKTSSRRKSSQRLSLGSIGITRLWTRPRQMRPSLRRSTVKLRRISSIHPNQRMPKFQSIRKTLQV